MLSQRAQDNGIPSITAPWPAKDIVYVAIIGPLMLAALIEWILWLVAFLYCLWKVWCKADQSKWAVRTLCLVNVVFFVCMRCIFLPVMVVTLPLPAQVVQYFPEKMVSILQWFAFYTFAALLVIPWLMCIFQLATHYVGREKRNKTLLDEYSAPKVVIIMPCYNEEPDVLLRTIDSIVDAEYPPSCMHVFLSFDGDNQESELFLKTIESLGVPPTLIMYPRSIDIAYRGLRVTVSRFPHGGKRKCQKNTFYLIDEVYQAYIRKNDNLFVLFIDSDCILDKACIANFMYDMELRPGSKRNMLAMTGVITSTTEKPTMLTLLQDMEYVHGQLFERSVESGCGAVTCLPGALTMLRFSAFRKMAKYYFADKAEQVGDMFDYGKMHLGEDRWLTHLFMIGAQKRHQIGMSTSAFCKTEAVQTYKSLLKQRRRWFLGFITNEVCMLTDPRLWRKYPLLLTIRLAQNTIRTTALLFFIMVISIISTSQKVANLPVGFIGVSLGLNWLLMLFFAVRLNRWKVTLYPLMFVVNPFFNWVYMVYGICTAGQRTWGGPRADAAKADEKTTAEQAVAAAKASGDELNIVPETFRDMVPLDRKKSTRAAPLLPSSRLEGRFAQPQQIGPGFYKQSDESSINLNPDMTLRDDEEEVYYHQGPRHTSTASWDSLPVPFARPRRVESIYDLQHILAYHQNQQQQRPAGGAFFDADRDHDEQQAVLPDYRNPRPELSRRSTEIGAAPRPEHHNAPALVTNAHQHRRRDSSVDSTRSAASDASVPLHFNVPRRPSSAERHHHNPRPPPAPAPVYAPTRATADNLLQIPGPAHLLPTRFAPGDSAEPSASRTGRSPLARKSFTRLATDDAPSTAGSRTEVEVRQPSRPEEEARGRRRQRRNRNSNNNTSVGADGRRRLSKQSKRVRGSSRSSSRA